MGSTRRTQSITSMMAAVGLLLAIPGNGQAHDASTSELAAAERHCVVEIVDVVDGVMVTGPETCFSAEREAQRYASTVGAQSGTSRSSATTIGTHYSKTGFGGSSITIAGTTCSGGVWYPAGSWNNAIEGAVALFDLRTCRWTVTVADSVQIVSASSSKAVAIRRCWLVSVPSS